MDKEKTFEINELNRLMDLIENPCCGLPEEVFEFVTTVTPMINVDILIRNERDEILLAWRDDYCGCAWHIPGGIIRYKELAEDRIQKTALKEIGTKVDIIKGPVEIHQIIMPHQIRGHFISMLYECRLPDNYVISDKMMFDPANRIPGKLGWHNDNPGLVSGQKEAYAHLFHNN